MSDKVLYLIDGTAICYRSFFAVNLSNSKGFPTGAIYGFLNTLKKIIKKYNPVSLVVCFDVSRKTFRQDKFKDYKIQRPPVPDGLKLQVPMIKNLINYMGIESIEKEGFEADDLIASLTKKAVEDNSKVVIVSSDKDFYQLIKGRQVCVYEPVKDKMYDEEWFIRDYGFVPAYMADYLSLTGDPTDNIPGAKGIGKVGAAKLVKTYGSIENIYNNLDKFSSRIKDSLIASKKEVFLSKDLVELSFPDLDFSWEGLKMKEPDYRELYNFFKEFGFKMFLKDIPETSLNIEIEIIDRVTPELIERIKTDRKVIFYPDKDKEELYILGERASTVYKASLSQLKGVFDEDSIQKISYFLKENFPAFKKEIECRGPWFDVKIAAYIIDPGLGDFTPENLVSKFLNIFIKEISPQALPGYIAGLYEFFVEELKNRGMNDLFFNLEMPLIEVLSDMESLGIKVDIEFLRRFSVEVKKRLSAVSREIYNIAGEKFNLNSPKQLRKILFEDLGISPLKRTKTGFSTNEEVLEKLADNYPIAKFLLEYRHLNKLNSAYLEPFLKEAEANGGRIFAKFNQTKTLTGRLSSSSPNLQNIPVKSDFAKGLRKAVISSFKSGFILCCDYSQIELRVLAHITGDTNLTDAFKKGLDIHTHTASLFFGIPQKEVLPRQRNLAKKINFGIIYGMSPYGLAKELDISFEEASSFIENYFARYPGVKRYVENICREAEEKGFVKTILGRRRYFPEMKSSNHEIKEFAKRAAINMPVQGSAADIIKMSMINISKEFKKENLKSKMIMQIHDELVFDIIGEDEFALVKKIVQKNMEESVSLDVPLKVNMKVGKNWLDLEEIK